MSNIKQKPILFKCDQDLDEIIESLKLKDIYKFNRNRLINDALRLYLEFMLLLQQPEYVYLNEVSFNEAHLQKILYRRIKDIQYEHPATRYKRRK